MKRNLLNIRRIQPQLESLRGIPRREPRKISPDESRRNKSHRGPRAVLFHRLGHHTRLPVPLLDILRHVPVRGPAVIGEDRVKVSLVSKFG